MNAVCDVAVKSGCGTKPSPRIFGRQVRNAQYAVEEGEMDVRNVSIERESAIRVRIMV